MAAPPPAETVPEMLAPRRAAPDSLGAFVAVIDQLGIVLMVNQAWAQLLDSGASPCLANEGGNSHPLIQAAGVGINYLALHEASPKPHLQHIAKGLRAVLEGAQTGFETVFRVPGTDRKSWIQLTASPLATGGAVVLYTDMTRLTQRLSDWELLGDIKTHEQARGQFLTYHDPLTALPNRQSALEDLRQLVYTGQDGQSQRIGLMSVELARFRDFNDAYGATRGDRLLKLAAAELLQLESFGYRLYRMSGPAFLLLLPSSCSQQDLMIAANRVHDLSDHCMRIEDFEVTLEFNIGATVSPQYGADPAMLLRHVAMARKRVPSDGSLRLRLYEPSMSSELLNIVQTGQALRKALEKQEFTLHYQPQIDLNSGRVIGAEALMRWNRPGHSLVGPVHFIGAAEESGLIRPMGRWALREACRQAAAWHSAGWNGLRIAVNLSPVQLRHDAIRWDVLDALEESGLDPSCLELELTESVLIEDGPILSETIAIWKSLGIKLAIDDFGTGYANLAYLKKLEIDTLKIDRSFISGMQDNKHDHCIVEAVLTMAKSLRLVTIAEGIEDAHTARQLANLGCDVGQGYLYSTPLPQEQFLQFLQLQDASSIDPP